MKNIFYLGAILGLVLVVPAQATLIGDTVDASATGMTTFGPSSATVDATFVPEFTGEIVDGVETITIEFDLRADTILIYIETNESGDSIVPDFSVTFSDLDWVGMPTYILDGVTINYDDPTETLGGTPGQGLTANVDDHSLELIFTSFELPEFREIELQLITKEDSGTGTPIPEPASLSLLAIGIGGLVLKRRLAA